ncbi:MAG: glycoside hydrolase family 3 N-terminal domain-containing protein [Flavobacteriaceae bacterium]
MRYTTIFLLILCVFASIAFDVFTPSPKPEIRPVTGILSDSLTEISTEKAYPVIEDENQKKWTDSIYNQMTLEEKIGQLFMVAAYSNKDEKHWSSLDSLIINQKIGGLIFFQGGPVRQAQLTNRFQAEAKVPLFIGIDAEWGLSMRLDSTYAFPWNMTLGAIQDNDLIEEMGRQMGKHSKRMGIHFNFAPVVDVNTNPLNPIIGNRSFGENPENVAQKAIALTKGLQSAGVFATAKHFPGHGDTDKDSHHTLPSVNHSLERMNQVELYPYKKLFKEGLASVMVAHLNVPALESRSGYPSSISKSIVTDLLQNKLKFKGLIFTDALNMKGASNFKSPGEIDLEAFLAGNDILLFPENVPVAIEKIKEALESGILSEDRLEHSVKKILKYKHHIGLNNYQPVEIQNLIEDLNSPENEALHYRLMENALTVIKNKNEVIPIKDIENQKIAYFKLGDDYETDFVESLQKYTEITVVEEDSLGLNGVLEKLQEFSTVIIGYHKSNSHAWRKHDFSTKELTWLYEIARTKNVILSVFARPYALMSVQTFENIEGLIVSYQNNKIAQELTAQLIFGSNKAKGKLPVSIGGEFEVGSGIATQQVDRLGFDIPENVGMKTEVLSKIDSIALDAISQKIAPGMQILVARNGKVVYQKSFGYHTYENQMTVENTDLYDVASLTKIMATLPLVIQEFDNDKLKLNTKLSEILPVFLDTDKKNITLKELLTHNSGFLSWLPFYKATLDSVTGLPSDAIYSNTYSEEFPYQVAQNLYIRPYSDEIVRQIAASKLGKKEYKYSDFPFILLKEYLEWEHQKTLDVLVQEKFYKSLGMSRTTYNPLRKFDMSEIVPTELDTYYRHQLLQGHVHDMGAAMQGGVAGHAGVFSDALGVAKIMQLYLQKGVYGDKQYFSEEVFDTFNSLYYDLKKNRRGLGFDKPSGNGNASTCQCVSFESFGHTGFTGTMAWADPKTQTIFVFLSNRTFPDANAPNKLARENIRTKIQEVITEAME